MRNGAGRVPWSGIYDRRVSGPNQLIHDRRRPLGAAQMRPDRGQRNLEKHETRPPELIDLIVTFLYPWTQRSMALA